MSTCAHWPLRYNTATRSWVCQCGARSISDYDLIFYVDDPDDDPLEWYERWPFGLPGPSPMSIYLRREIASVVADMRRGYGRMRPTMHDGHLGAVGGE